MKTLARLILILSVAVAVATAVLHSETVQNWKEEYARVELIREQEQTLWEEHRRLHKIVMDDTEDTDTRFRAWVEDIEVRDQIRDLKELY